MNCTTRKVTIKLFLKLRYVVHTHIKVKTTTTNNNNNNNNNNKKPLFIRKKDNTQILGVIPFLKLQNDS